MVSSQALRLFNSFFNLTIFILALTPWLLNCSLNIKFFNVKGVVPSIFLRRVRTLESLKDTLLFARTKTVQYFSKYEPFFWLCLKIDFPLLPTSLEKPQLPTDVTTITDAHNLLRRDKNYTTILTWSVKEKHSYCQQYVTNAFSIDNNSNNSTVLPL